MGTVPVLCVGLVVSVIDLYCQAWRVCGAVDSLSLSYSLSIYFTRSFVFSLPLALLFPRFLFRSLSFFLSRHLYQLSIFVCKVDTQSEMPHEKHVLSEKKCRSYLERK